MIWLVNHATIAVSVVAGVILSIPSMGLAALAVFGIALTVAALVDRRRLVTLKRSLCSCRRQR